MGLVELAEEPVPHKRSPLERGLVLGLWRVGVLVELKGLSHHSTFDGVRRETRPAAAGHQVITGKTGIDFLPNGSR